MAVPLNYNSSQPFGGAQAGDPDFVYQSAETFLTAPRPSFMPAHDAFPAQSYPDHMIAGSGSPVLPSTALIAFDNPALGDLPPISSLFTRPRPVLTSG